MGLENGDVMRQTLQGKVILVTGGARRVGAALVRALHAEGATTVVHYRHSAADAEALVQELQFARPGSASALAADLLDAEAPAALIEAVVARHGRLDALVNNASTFYPSPLGSIDAVVWDDLVGSNFRAPLLLSQAAAPHLRASGGAIVNITDIHGERPLPGYPLYCAAKAALIGLTRALAVELAPEVRVNAVSPGPILWPEDAQFNPSARAGIVAHTLLKREGRPDDIAQAVRFLLGEASYLTGQIINVDGGRSAHL